MSKNRGKICFPTAKFLKAFGTPLFWQSGGSNRCRLRSQFKPPPTAADYGRGRNSGDNNQGMATVPGPGARVLSTTTLLASPVGSAVTRLH